MKHIVFVESNANGLSAIKTAKELGYFVTFIRSPHFEHYYINDKLFDQVMNVIDNYIEVEDITNEKALAQVLESIHKDLPVDALITVSEHVILPLAKAAHEVGVPFTSAEAVELARHKGKMRQCLQENGVPSARYGFCSDFNQMKIIADTLDYPLIFKPASGLASFFTQKVNTLEELKVAYDEYKLGLQKLSDVYSTIMTDEIILEEYLEGLMVSLEISVTNGNAVPLAICKRKRYSKDEILELGSTMPAELSSSRKNDVYEYGKKVLSAIGLDIGIFHLEIMLTSNGPRLIEANPRLIGGMGPRLLSLTLGKDIYGVLIDAHLGNAILTPDEKPSYYSTSSVLALEEEYVCTDDLDISWLKEYEPSLIYHRFGLKPGDKVPKASSNEHSFGYFIVRAETSKGSEDLAETILERFREELSLPVIVN
ncbi:MAG: ATP-grasp domain-containing protein [Desulforhopalus sp.]